MESRIAEIIRLEKVAAKSAKPVSADRWRAAELIYAELQPVNNRAGKSQNQLAGEIGQSQTHVRYMARCWEIAVVRPGLEFATYADLPDFAEIYRSDEVRGADTTPGHKSRPRGAGRKPRQKQDTDDDGLGQTTLAQKAAAAINILDQNPAFLDLMTPADLAALRAARPALDRVIAGAESAQRAA